MSTPQTCHCLCPHSEPQALPTSTGDPLILVVESGPVSYQVSAIFPGYWCMWDFYKPSKNEDFVCPSPLASPLAFKSRFSKGILLLLLEPQAGKLDMRLRTYSCGSISVVKLFSSLWATHVAGMEFHYAVPSVSLPLCLWM